MNNKSQEAAALLANPVFKEGVQAFRDKYEEECYSCELDGKTAVNVILAKRIAREFIETFEQFIDEQQVKDYNDSCKERQKDRKPEFKR